MSEIRSPKSGILSFREKRAIRYIVFFVIVSRLLLMFRSEEKIYSRPYLEDSYYLFNCAEHFAHGEGFSCDGIHPTNGVQPLIVILYAPLFLIAGADKLLALRLGFILIALFDSLSVILIARLVRILQKKPSEEDSLWKSPPVIAAILWAALYPVFVHTGGGLETGLYSTMLLASVYYYVKIMTERKEGKAGLLQWAALGILLGITVLARIDAVFLVIAIGCCEVYKFKGKGIRNAAVISVFAFIVSSPWWLYNYRVFGSLMPQSGASESLGNGMVWENLLRGAVVISDIFTVFFFLPYYDLPAWFFYFWICAVLAIVLWIIRRYELRPYLKNTYTHSVFIPFLCFCGSLAIYYIFFFSAPHFLPRYFHPFRIIWLVIFACVWPKIVVEVQHFFRRKNKMPLVLCTIVIVAAIAFSGRSYIYYFTISKPNDFYQAGKFALQHPAERIGMQQSGTSGFIASNVVNLDGKVNFDALKAKKRGDIGAYIEKERLDYIADWRELSAPMVASAALHGGKFRESDSIGRIIIFKRVR